MEKLDPKEKERDREDDKAVEAIERQIERETGEDLGWGEADEEESS